MLLQLWRRSKDMASTCGKIMRQLLEWIKKFNASQEYRPDSVVYVFGIDCQQIYRSLKVLAEVDFALCQELKARLSFFNGHSEDEHEYAKKTVRGIGSENIPEILQGILSEFQWKHFDRLKAKLPKEKLLDILNIEQNIEVLVNAEEYFRKMVLEPAGSNVSWNTRDQHMALTVSRIRERLGLVTAKGDDDVQRLPHRPRSLYGPITRTLATRRPLLAVEVILLGTKIGI